MKFSAIFLLLFSLPALAESHYSIFVDAGSSGSRLHIYQTEDSQSMPIINDVFSDSIRPGLSSFQNSPQQAGQSLQKLLTEADQWLQTNGVADRSEVVINVMATAGMRALNDSEQTAIYQNLTAFIKNNYNFHIGDIKTIDGQTEALYGWLDINYLKQNFQTYQSTVGSIDLGGASTQIAYAVEDHRLAKDKIEISINQKNYSVFTKSFKLGQDVTQALMDQHPLAASCYSPGNRFKKSARGFFFMPICAEIYDGIINKQDVKNNLIPNGGQSFLAYSGVYYSFNFFAPGKKPGKDIIEQRVSTLCSLPWELLKKLYKNKVPEKYLSSYCANGVYSERLLFETYKLADSQLEVADKINNITIDWTLGAALYQMVS